MIQPTTGFRRRGLFVTDGNSVSAIGDVEGINKYIRDNIAESEYPQVVAYHNKVNSEVIWSLPIAWILSLTLRLPITTLTKHLV